LLTGIQEGAGFIADEDEEDEEEEARRERRRRKKRKNREADEALDDEDLDLIGVEIEKPEETQVGWLRLATKYYAHPSAVSIQAPEARSQREAQVAWR
jgi:hypothetical protein